MDCFGIDAELLTPDITTLVTLLFDAPLFLFTLFNKLIYH
ncbi:hypothetical protein ABID99_000868 [Mucilaginibacter sp. OAE612]